MGVFLLLALAMLVQEGRAGDRRLGRNAAGSAPGEGAAAKWATLPAARDARIAVLYGTTRPATPKLAAEHRANHNSLEAQGHRGTRSSSRRRSRRRRCRRPHRPTAMRHSWLSCRGATTCVPSRWARNTRRRFALGSSYSRSKTNKRQAAKPVGQQLQSAQSRLQQLEQAMLKVHEEIEELDEELAKLHQKRNALF